MKAGNFNMFDYLNKLNEEAEATEKALDKDGIIIPDTNKKAYDWLKSEFQKAKTEVTVSMTSAKFTPGMSFSGAKDFKPGISTGENGGKSVPKLDNGDIKDAKGEGAPKKLAAPKTADTKTSTPPAKTTTPKPADKTAAPKKPFTKKEESDEEETEEKTAPKKPFEKKEDLSKKK
jgi:hypothetical protein